MLHYKRQRKVIRPGPADGTGRTGYFDLLNHILTERPGDSICQRGLTVRRGRYDLWCTYKTTTTHTSQNWKLNKRDSQGVHDSGRLLTTFCIKYSMKDIKRFSLSELMTAEYMIVLWAGSLNDQMYEAQYWKLGKILRYSFLLINDGYRKCSESNIGAPNA